ncbi:MAG: DNA/RNA non-specific endonuclease [Bacteroidaceae bacterium]|nr:DNA/RNA non-specific endonuclease [Prevotella sp.]MBR4534702.1 DNA/RNA non-specific endonuclease [Bacteroidaceae bacterium]
MKRETQRILLLLVTLLPFFLWSCSSNDDELDSATANINANLKADGPEAARLEIPKLKGGVVNRFLVKKLSSGEVNFCIEWDIAKKAQRWTAFRWDNTNSGGYIKREDNFIEDTDIPEEYRTTYENYRGSGYTRGHICASADRWNSLEANRQTFLYSNMQPQLYSFNGGIWANMEMKVRSWNTADFRDTLYVVKGGTIDHNSDIIEHTSTGLLVPKYFFMAILCKNKSTVNEGYKAIGFYLEHRSFYEDEKTLSPYIVSIDKLENLTGIDFFCNLPDRIENQVENNVTPAAWGFQ